MAEKLPLICDKPGMRRTCTLIITHQCNLNCTYCYQAHKSSQQMQIDLAKEIIEKEFNLVAHRPDFSQLQIDFMGGEPLIRFDMMAELAEWVWSMRRPVPYIFFASTNGTLLNDTTKAWFTQHKKQFYLGLSVDGSPETQEKNRKGSSLRIDPGFFRTMWPEQAAKMTLSRESLPTLASDVIYLHELGFAISFNPAHGISWTDEDAILYERQLDNLAEYYLQQDGKIAPASMFTPNFANLHGAQTSPPKFCGTGTHMVTYDVDGSAYPCHMFAPIVMGQNRSDEIKRIDFTAPENLVDPKCVACPLFPMCPTCYGFNYKYRNHVAIRDLDYCKMYKRQVGAACRFQIDRLARKGIASTRNGMMEAKCLVHAYDVLRELMSAR